MADFFSALCCDETFRRRAAAPGTISGPVVRPLPLPFPGVTRAPARRWRAPLAEVCVDVR